MIVGQGQHRYELVEDWEQLPQGWRHGDVAGVATDSQDRVYVFNRSEHPLIDLRPRRPLHPVLGRRHLHPPARHHDPRTTSSTWRTTATTRCASSPSTASCCRRSAPSTSPPTPATRPQVAHSPSIHARRRPFNRPTRLSVAPNGDLYVSDGYGNARIHRFSANGDAAAVLGRARHRPGPVQPAAQRLGPHRRPRLRLRPRERPRPDLQPGGRLPQRLDQREPPRRPLHRRGQPRLHRRDELVAGPLRPDRLPVDRKTAWRA